MELLVTITTPPDLLSNITPSPTLQVVIKPIPQLLASINTNLRLVNGLSAYEVAILNGFIGTEEEWLASLIGQQGIQGEQGLQGLPGQDGEPIELRVANNYIQYKYLSDIDWINLKNLDELKGADGQEIELVLDNDWLKWKYLTDTTWTNLVALSAITGAAGVDGREVLIRNNGTAIQWKYSTDLDWLDIELLVNLKGTNGLDGLDGLNGIDGREIELNKSLTHIQWRYVGELTWLDLIALIDLKGADGPDGANALINGYNTLTINATGNVELNQVNDVITLDTVDDPNFTGLHLNTNIPLVLTNPGDLGWNSIDGTLDIKLNSDVTLQTGQEVHFYGKASGAISNGDLVQFAGAQGAHFLIKKVVPAEISTNPHYLMGIATQNIVNNTFGYVTMFGKINGVYTTGWSIGDILYYDNSTGQLTNTPAIAPNRKIIIAAVIKESTGNSENGIIFVRITFGKKLVEHDDVYIDSPTNGSVLSWVNSTNRWEPKEIQTALAVDYLLNGFVSILETTITFNAETYTFTINPSGSAWSYYRLGLKHTIIGAKSVTLAGSPPTSNKYYIYLDSVDGILSSSTTSWTLGETETKVPVATITFDNTLTPKYLLGDERHPLIPRNEHRYEHLSGGTKLITRTTITTLNIDQDNAVDKRPTLSQGEISDEYLFITQAALTPAGNPYTSTDYAIVYRTSSTTWAWMKSAMPFKYDEATTTIQYDNNGIMTNGTGGVGSNKRWFNYYLIQTNITNDGFQFVWMPGRGSFTSLALAQAEDVSAFRMTEFPVTEFVIVYRVTFAIDAIYNSAGKCVFKANQQVNIGNTVNIISNTTISVPIKTGTLTTVNGYFSELNFRYISPKDFIWNNILYNTSNGAWIDNLIYTEIIAGPLATSVLLTSLSFDITGIDGIFSLTSAGALTTVNLSNLVFVGGNTTITTALQTLNLASLKIINGTFALNYVSGANINLGALEYVQGSITITLNPSNANNITLLNTLKCCIGAITFTAGNTAFDLNLNNLIITTSISDNANIKSILAPNLKVWNTAFILGISNPSLTSVSFAALEYIGGNLSISNKANLTSINFSSIKIINGAVSIITATANITTMTLGTGLKCINGNVVISSCALNQASVDNILNSLAALDGTNGTIAYSSKTVTITGTSSTPSATGLAAKATLIARGCTVTTN